MRKIIFGAVLACLIISLGCSNSQKVITESKENEFNFVLKYGISARNEIDTFNGTCTKDLIAAGNKTIQLKLTAAELDDIEKQMREINILDYPEKFEPNINQYVTPNITYHLRITMDGKIKEIHWEDYNCFDVDGIVKPVEPVEATHLRDVFKNVISIIERKEEHKKLPQSVGGYD